MPGTYVVQLIVNNGSWDSPRDKVTVNVSLPTVIVPDVINLLQADAEAAVTAAQLVVGNITGAYSSIIPEGNIVSQSPAAGTSVTINSSVDLVVSLGVQMVVMMPAIFRFSGPLRRPTYMALRFVLLGTVAALVPAIAGRAIDAGWLTYRNLFIGCAVLAAAGWVMFLRMPTPEPEPET